MSRWPLYAIVLGKDGLFVPVEPEDVRKRARLLRLRHSQAVAEKLNADLPAEAASDEAPGLQEEDAS